MNENEYLSFTKKERNGIIILLLILAGMIIVPRLFRNETLPSETAPTSQIPNEDPPDNSRQHINSFRNYSNNHTTVRHRQKSRKPPTRELEINAADTAAFIALPGIGNKLASRIVLFREKLGGFVSVSQIGEIYGLNDTVFNLILPYLRCDTTLVRKIYVNQAEKEELKAHPYIRWNVANILVNYRHHHGPFRSINDLWKIETLDSSLIQRLEPYLSFN